jgi:hypothetical protein
MSAIARLEAASRLTTDAGSLARELLPLLKQAVEEMAEETVSRPSRRGTGKVAYLVETTQQGEVLTEERLSGKSKAFRCPKSVYDAVAEVLSKAERPLLLDEIMSAVGEKLGDRPADHQVRVALRFWMHSDPPLVVRNRARYRQIPNDDATRQAGVLWDRLQRQF